MSVVVVDATVVGSSSAGDVEDQVKGRKVQSLRSLREEMKAVARGEQPAPPDAGKPSFNSAEALEWWRSPSGRGRVYRRQSRAKSGQ